VALVVLALFVGLLARPAHAKNFTVNSTGDAGDLNLADSVCDAHPHPWLVSCTLRAAIQEANDTPGADVINFNIPDNPNIPGLEVKTIKPKTALPMILEQVSINGYTQPGASPNTKATGNDAVLKIELDGSGAGSSEAGLPLNAPNSVIKGLVINRFVGGIKIYALASGAKIEGNFIGTDPSGTQALGNDGGVHITNAVNNTVGGASPAARNVISGNGGGGVHIFFSAGNKVQGNLIGTKKDGAGPLGNSGSGVNIFSSPNNLVGGSSSGAANTIAFNGKDGVRIHGNGSNPGNRILSNSIHSNGDLGIDLEGGTEDANGVTANDFKDPDTGPNNLQNYPVLTSATTSGGQTTITGSLNSLPGKQAFIQFFSSPQADPSGFGEGKTFLGLKRVETNTNGNTSFTLTTTLPARGNIITATATGSDGTSEFSQFVVAN
jgi:CSLREA domain-containing protein